MLEVEYFEDFLCLWREFGGEGDVMAVDGAGELAEWPDCGDGFLEGLSGGGFHVSGDGQGGEYGGEVGFDRVTGVVKDRAGFQVVCGNAERLLNMP